MSSKTNSAALAGLLILTTFVWTGCSDPSAAAAGAQARQELEQLRQENDALQQLAGDHEEAQRLRKENQEIHQLRAKNQEVVRLRSENDQLRAQIARSGNAAAAAAAAAANRPAAAPAAQPVAVAGAVPPGANEADIPMEGDEIFIQPQLLGLLIPQIDWSKVERTEPVGVKGLLDQHGIVLTNYQQLHQIGITNYVIQRKGQPQQSGAPQP
jgi:TolA-binding protein